MDLQGVEVSVWPAASCRSLPDEDKVCPLRGTVQGLQEEMEDFRRGVERQLEDVLRLAGPLSRSVTDLQCENRRLREQVEKLSRQVEALSRAAGQSGEGQTRYSSHALLSVSAKAQSVVPEAQNDVDSAKPTSNSVVENGHQSYTEKAKMPLDSVSEARSPPTQEHLPAMSVRVPHMPVTAVTKVCGDSHSTTYNGSNRLQASESKSPMEMASKQSSTQGAVRTWNASIVRTMGVTANSEKNISSTKSTQSYSVSNSSIISESTDRYFDVTPKSHSPPPALSRQPEKKRELMRSQTLPRSSGTQVRKAFFEKFEQDSGKGKGESKVKLKRSQSFGVASASSIKQILLEWCRSKTIGYKNIDLQNFSSSWSDGMAFCALVHSFFPEAFDYDALVPSNPKQNFEQAFSTAEKMAHCDRLIEVEDMLMMGRKPDPMCVFTYVQSLYNHLRRFE
ncbi:smoothelin-like protein 2 isoform X2 [Bufo bufo]|uniref:smoothelin-like protein 2 isoform X2 n=1 Tax=Bufo bufo TaxID=8384 RepID=UPI001ABDF7CF|nr:smoothelin-like protein 2 isoform X2 [Bufo bufo]